MTGTLGTWNVYPVNLVGPDQYGRWAAGPIDQICGNLQDLFTEVSKSPACPYRGVSCKRATPGFKPAQGEAIIYFVTKSSSLIAASGGPRPGGSGGTYAVPAKGIISEVYVDEWLSNGDYLKQAARLMFHELLHDKVEADGSDDVVHKDGTGLATANPISGSTPLTASNKKMMGSNMQKAVAQYDASAWFSLVFKDDMPVSINGKPPPSP